MADIYESVPAASLKRSYWRRRRERNMTMDMGFIYPFFIKELIPGDIMKVNLSAFIRVQPMVAAPFTPMRFYAEFWFCPTRVLMQKLNPEIVDGWETFIFGGPKGNGQNEAGQTPILPRWVPNATGVKLAGWHVSGGVQSRRTGNADAIGSLWDCFGFPTGTGYNALDDDGIDSNNVNYYRWCPLAFPKIMYNLVWNEFKRNENLEASVDLMSDDVQQCKWKHEYFSSALPFQQRGDPVALPLGAVFANIVDNQGTPIVPVGTLPKNYAGVVISGATDLKVKTLSPITSGAGAGQNFTGQFTSKNANGTSPRLNSDQQEIFLSSQDRALGLHSITGTVSGNSNTMQGTLYPLLTNSQTDIADLRLMFQTQKFMERAARGGVRYIEGLLSFFGTAPHNDVLNLPQFIGGMKQNIIVNEVLQTSQTSTTPQGNIAGRGISAARDNIGTVHAREHGYLMGICWIKPDLYYANQGIRREMLRVSRYDFFWPQFAHLSERPIYTAELFASPSTMTPAQLGDGTAGLFGYTGIYNEYRSEENEITGHMRDTFKYWHLAREFSSAPELEADFVNCKPRKDIFAVQDEDNFLVDILTDLKMYRPIPLEPNPGLIDHF